MAVTRTQAKAKAATPNALRSTNSLRWTLALVITAFSLFPPVIMALFFVEVRREVWLDLAWRLVLIALLSGGVGYVISRAILQPLDRLRQEVSSLVKPGQRLEDLTLGDAGPLPVEVETLRTAFSSVLEALRGEQSKRNAFMATLVHDLKTPVIAANHVLEVIQNQENLGRDERIRLVSHLRAENDALLSLVQRMVDAHRFEREGISLQLETVDLGAFAAKMAGRFRPAANSKGLQVVYGGAGLALGAPRELERAVSNLLENALRYARSTIRLEVNGASLTVADDGPGMQADLDVLAQPFNSQQVELGGQRFTSGTGGLGLFIARQIVLAHGGTLERLYDRPGTALRITLKTEGGRP